MRKLAIIGQKDKIIFFKALGVEIFPIQKIEDIEKASDEIKKAGNFGIVFVDSKYLKETREKFQKIKDGLPVVLSLPLCHKKEETSGELNEIIKRAIGTEKITIK